MFRGPTVRDRVTRVGAPTGRNLRGPNMLLAVVVECAEARTAILALSQNDQPLSEEDGPFRIVMAGETHRARWARQVERIRVVRVGN